MMTGKDRRGMMATRRLLANQLSRIESELDAITYHRASTLNQARVDYLGRESRKLNRQIGVINRRLQPGARLNTSQAL